MVFGRRTYRGCRCDRSDCDSSRGRWQQHFHFPRPRPHKILETGRRMMQMLHLSLSRKDSTRGLCATPPQRSSKSPTEWFLEDAYSDHAF